MIRRARHLAVFLLALATILLVSLEGRLFYLQVVKACEPGDTIPYRTQADRREGMRGELLDRRGGCLARTVEAVDVFAWSPDVSRPKAVADILFELTGADPFEIRDKLASERWPRLVEDVRDPQVIRSLREIGGRWPCKGLRVQPRYHRVYPQGERYAPLLGFVDAEGVGRSGLEAHFEDRLQPISREEQVRRDGRGRLLGGRQIDSSRETGRAAIHLTVEPVLQEAAELAMDSVMAEFRPRWCQALVMDPWNGDLLAMAQRPAPRVGRPESGQDWDGHRILAVEEAYLPGSTLKPHMVGYALQRGVISAADSFHCGNGVSYFGKRRLSDIHGGYGDLSIEQILVHSSNIGMAKIACRLVTPGVTKGSAEFQPILDYYRALGFGQRLWGMTGESAGLMTPRSRFRREYSLVSLSFGHAINVTAVQMIGSTAAFANGGYWVRPRLALSAHHADGHVEEFPVDGYPLLEESVARDVSSMLAQVVEQGETERHRPRGYSMGGKTGTPEKEENRSLISPSFFCYGPVQHPRAIVLVVVDEPKSGRYASGIAAPSAARLLGTTLRFLQVPPDRPEELWEERWSSG